MGYQDFMLDGWEGCFAGDQMFNQNDDSWQPILIAERHEYILLSSFV